MAITKHLLETGQKIDLYEAVRLFFQPMTKRTRNLGGFSTTIINSMRLKVVHL